jgi:predicted molibdopterin-dependent oxidoreductase YjgC
MPEISINNTKITVQENSTILDAAEKLGISIPTMCHLKGSPAFTSCMICVVKHEKTGALIPACSALVEDGMIITTDTDETRDARRTALELLFSEHLGDCEGPCHRVCPAHINIPQLIRHVANRDIAAASGLLREAHVSGNPCEHCTQQCEKACRRSQHDGAVSIRHLIEFVHASEPASSKVNAESSETDKAKRFNCSMGRLLDGEMDTFLTNASSSPRIEPANGATASFTIEEAANESLRCLRCDCRKAESCKLRDYADTYQVQQRRYKPTARAAFKQVRQHTDIVYEPGKCIKCGLCVKITEKHCEPFGLTFIGRGLDLQIEAPFNESLDKALTTAANDCVDACPTAALAHTDKP